jgi:hypothetical protein
VLDGSLYHRVPSSVPPYFTNRRPDDWRLGLKSRNPSWAVELGPIQFLRENRYDIVVNPFGEAYPEEDLALHTTLKQLTEYVYSGGVYVNVAGYPFFWQHNPTTNVTTESGRWELKADHSTHLIQGNLKPILSDTLLGIHPDMSFQEKQVKTLQSDTERKRFGEIAGEGGESKVIMFRPYPMSTQSMIPMLCSENRDHIILGSVPYGTGFFLFFGIKIDNQTKAFEKSLAAIKGWAQYEANSRKD